MNDYQELASKATCLAWDYKTVLQLNIWGKTLVDQYDPDENFTNVPDNDIDYAVGDALQEMGLENNDEQEEVVVEEE